MKKYIIFAYDYYYPTGGLGDIKEDANTRKEAVKLGKKTDYQNVQIVDRDTWKIGWEK
jgi:hypothetical protein